MEQLLTLLKTIPEYKSALAALSNKESVAITGIGHLYGKAADIKVQGIAPSEVAKYAETLLDEGGIGIYNTFTHIDVRSTKSRWQG